MDCFNEATGQKKLVVLLLFFCFFYIHLLVHWTSTVIFIHNKPATRSPYGHFHNEENPIFAPVSESEVGYFGLDENPTKEWPFNSSMKIIYYWNSYFRWPDYGFGFGNWPFIRAKCPYSSCYITNNTSMVPLEEVDAIVWHFRSFGRRMPDIRSGKTRYVFLMKESADNLLFWDIDSYDNIFNWTMTYRLDSDIPFLYNRMVQRTVPLKKYYKENLFSSETLQLYSSKTKKVSWLVSHCKTQCGREKLAHTLNKYIQVDIYGQCGDLTCPYDYSCMKYLERNYKFYLAFENSLCRDYVTEKLFNSLSFDIIPVVYGFGPYTFHAPPHSYIDVFDFPSVKDLAEYLKYLDRNHSAYMEYFEWKAFYKPLPEDVAVAAGFCKLCEKLHTDTTYKSYRSLKDWFVKKSNCITEADKRLIQFINGR